MSEKNYVKVMSIYKRFGGKYINKDKNNEIRRIEFPGFTRLGMELNGVFLHKKMLSVVCWGKQESTFLNKLSKNLQEKILRKILIENPPLFLISKNFEHTEKLLAINKEINNNNSAIICVDYSTSEIFSLVGTWLSKALAVWHTIHGTVISIYGEGTLIIGPAGIGKSEIALELLKMNHLFLADDAIDIARLGNVIIAKANLVSNNFIQIRGLGILNVKDMYGNTKIITDTKISVIIELKHSIESEINIFENLGESIKYKELLGISIPLYKIPVTKGRKISDIIELAVIDMKLKKQGHNPAKELNNRVKKIIAS